MFKPKNDILWFSNKDRNTVLLVDSFNNDVKNAFTSGLWMYNDYQKDSWLIATLSEKIKSNLNNSNFDQAKTIINENVKKGLNSENIIKIGTEK